MRASSSRNSLIANRALTKSLRANSTRAAFLASRSLTVARLASKLDFQPQMPEAIASTNTAARPLLIKTRRRFAKRSVSAIRFCSFALSSTKLDSSEFSQSGWLSRSSTASSKWGVRYNNPRIVCGGGFSRRAFCHATAASVRRRWISMPRRCSLIHFFKRSQPRIKASCAISTPVSSDTMSRVSC